jgi:hypothetical protein
MPGTSERDFRLGINTPIIAAAKLVLRIQKPVATFFRTAVTGPRICTTAKKRVYTKASRREIDLMELERIGRRRPAIERSLLPHASILNESLRQYVSRRL